MIVEKVLLRTIRRRFKNAIEESIIARIAEMNAFKIFREK